MTAVIAVTHREYEVCRRLGDGRMSSDVAVACGITYDAARACLDRLHDRGAVVRDAAFRWRVAPGVTLQPCDSLRRRHVAPSTQHMDRTPADTARFPSERAHHYGTDGDGRLIGINERGRAPWSPWGREQRHGAETWRRPEGVA